MNERSRGQRNRGRRGERGDREREREQRLGDRNRERSRGERKVAVAERRETGRRGG